MSHASKSKAKGISASSFFDLKAELSKQEVEFAKAKAAGNVKPIVGGIKRPDKKPSVWARQNKGVSARAIRDIELEEVTKPTLDSARATLERKAKIYEKLRKGKTGGLSDVQYDALLVDFDSGTAMSKYYEADSADEDESLRVPVPPTDDDPIVEYEDEFGRIRTARRSEVPRNLRTDLEETHNADRAAGNPVNHFPTYQPSEEHLAEIAKAFSEENNPLNIHYDASREVRAKGAGFYQFSADEETRKAQLEELKASREETERIRKEMGAEDIKSGEFEGMRDGEAGTAGATGIQSRAMEKRKRDIEERRQLLEAKRRKLRGTDAPTPPSDSISSKKKPVEASTDPFAALEALSQGKGKNNVKSVNDADSFLAQLEEEFLGSK
ncbi:hypothetical protein CPB84DRAFT_1680805 [Gymnopilus junonius]|uniref:Uncharacterized protein n=1 Tax=Gymnopilus junonius TaxID=109634 RepID=A0A9P5NMT5_GYMJU|nr:hypothetical protein CPB84DRAFT_1680805 [Gymnopilus junonius]